MTSGSVARRRMASTCAGVGGARSRYVDSSGIAGQHSFWPPLPAFAILSAPSKPAVDSAVRTSARCRSSSAGGGRRRRVEWKRGARRGTSPMGSMKLGFGWTYSPPGSTPVSKAARSFWIRFIARQRGTSDFGAVSFFTSASAPSMSASTAT